ncbi:MAG: ABC transporter permease [Armatimonadota bacterium]|nr:ABC transporter permease [Armatimonadota bacterium]MDR7422036.1 ABC transporter permease [Armatimonadota bacterium]MDR7458097.1 ABC transporter permease [Armatimonadota bacterium]MDR7498045.1 ABC transporter permease [Armatimonadota bacterium]MDR7512879.1 ABC transporter permease [Armatimonadota bacterium]
MPLVARRLLAVAPTVLVVATVTFLALQVIPGDIAQVMLGVDARPEDLARLRREFGLDRPLVLRYLEWLGHLARGDLGTSITYREPVARLIVARMPVTLSVALGAMVVAVGVALPLGVIAARRAWSPGDLAVLAGSQLGLAIPTFWLGILLLLGLAAAVPLFPLQGYAAFSAGPAEWLRHLTLPAVALGTERAAALVRLVRGSVLEEMTRDYVRTARGKGLAAAVVLRRHVLRNALIPVLTVAGLQLGYLMGGTIVIEQVFGLPGLGRLLLQGIYARDLVVVQGAVITIALTFALLNLAIDLLYTAVDPRITYD